MERPLKEILAVLEVVPTYVQPKVTVVIAYRLILRKRADRWAQRSVVYVVPLSWD